ncbi:MAG: short-chain dehydrogenase [Chitinophagaceae bacterium]|nr:short-chain dehydrogenase [Chitinophagaceae bacterium]
MGLSLVNLLLSTQRELTIHGCSRHDPNIDDSRFHFYEIDLAHTEKLYEQANDFLRSVSDLTQKIVLVNNAGSLGHTAFVGHQNISHYQRVMSINSLAPMVLSEVFVKQFQDQEAEKVVFNISSGAAQKDMEGWAAYCASKAALDRFTGVCAKEQLHQLLPIHFHSISPGVMDTPMQEEIRKAPIENFPSLNRFVDLYQSGELMLADEAAKKVMKLLNEASIRNVVYLSLRNF